MRKKFLTTFVKIEENQRLAAEKVIINSNTNVNTLVLQRFLKPVKAMVTPGWGCLFAGMVAALALPPFNFWPLFLLGFSYWFRHVHCDSTRYSVWERTCRTWYFGFGYYFVSTHWVAASLRFEEGMQWLIPIAPIVISGVQSLYLSLTTAIILLSTKTWNNPNASLWRGLIHCGAIPLIELAQYNEIIGFPWGQAGMIFTGHLELLQTTALWGIHGLSMIAHLLGLATFSWVYKQSYRCWLVIVSAVIFAICFLWGAQRLGRAPIDPAQPHVFVTNEVVSDNNSLQTPTKATHSLSQPVLRIVHPGIPQTEKWNQATLNRQFSRFVDLSQHRASPYSGAIDYLLWPEAIPFCTIDCAQTSIGLLKALHTSPQFLITGCVRRRINTTNSEYFNSIIAVDRSHDIVGTYDKKHLVPFGEFIPLSKLLPLPAIAAQNQNYSPGIGPGMITSTNLLPFTPLVCFDAIFSGDVVAQAANNLQAVWMLNVTNDAWFAGTIGPAQHFEQVRIRAIEEGIPLVRAANSGVSAIIDCYGRILARLEPDQIGTIDSTLPLACTQRPPFARYGHRLIVIAGIVLIFIACMINFFSNYRKTSPQ